MKGICHMKWIDLPQNNVPYLAFDMMEQRDDIVAAFTTKRYYRNGKPDDFYQPLLRPESDPDEVACCVQLLVSQFGTDQEHLVSSAQKHMANIHLVDAGDLGPAAGRRNLEAIDGLITDMPGVMLRTFGADCPSVYLYDPVRRAIGLCHSGRKGTQLHIAARLLNAMQESFGTDPGDVLAAVSPGICGDCYEVGDEVAEDFSADYRKDPLTGSLRCQSILSDIISKKTGRYHIDLFAAIFHSLRDAGIPGSNIELPGMCTKCRSDLLYSFRAEGRISNENCAILMLRS